MLGESRVWWKPQQVWQAWWVWQMVDTLCIGYGKYFGYSEQGGNGYCSRGHSETTCRVVRPKAKVAGRIRTWANAP